MAIQGHYEGTNGHGDTKQNCETFLFTSESVGAGHPGKRNSIFGFGEQAHFSPRTWGKKGFLIRLAIDQL